jgi:hypothetical protein
VTIHTSLPLSQRGSARIPGYSALIFDIELIELLDCSGGKSIEIARANFEKSIVKRNTAAVSTEPTPTSEKTSNKKDM